MSAIGDLIHTARIEAGVSSWELAARAGVSDEFVRKIEQGTRSPSPPTAAVLAAALGLDRCEVLEVLGRTKENCWWPTERALSLRGSQHPNNLRDYLAGVVS